MPPPPICSDCKKRMHGYGGITWCDCGGTTDQDNFHKMLKKAMARQDKRAAKERS